MPDENIIPADFRGQIVPVGSLSELMSAQFTDAANVILFPRTLSMDFNRLAQAMAERFDLGAQGPVCFHDDPRRRYHPFAQLEELVDQNGDPQLRVCLDVIQGDVRFAREEGLDVTLKLVTSYRRSAGVSANDFHVDGQGSNTQPSRFLVCYNEPGTEGVHRDDVLDASAQTLAATIKEDARRFQFRSGNMWRHMVYDDRNMHMASGKIGPFVHRGIPSEHPRLLLTS
jgi:hypothetical protein